VARALRRPALAAALAALVGASTLLHWLAGRRIDGLWIMPDEAIYGVRALDLWRNGSLPLLHDGAGYSLLYPALAGGPLSLGSVPSGFAWLKAVQALVMSLAAVPVFLAGRRMMPAPYALVAAALTVASPVLLFSGFVMTEVVYYPLAAATLLAIARAVRTAVLRDQALALLLVAAAVATRVQAVVLVGVFALAVLVEAAFARRPPRVRAFWPVWSLVGAGLAVVVLAPTVLGAYSVTVSRGYPLASALHLVYDHLAYVVVMVAVVPAAAFVVLLWDGLRGREHDDAARALLAVAISAVLLVVAQVGVFASGYSPHLLGRDLAALPPPLFLCFSLWLARGAPRPRAAASVTAVGLVALLVGVPWNELSVNALPDSMGMAILVRRFCGASPASTVAIGAALLLVGFRLLPRRAAPLLAVAAFALLGATSVVASNLTAPTVRTVQTEFVGAPRDWISRFTQSPVAYVFNGDTSGWPVVWQQQFWNPQIDRVLSFTPANVPGPIRQRRIAEPADGLLPISERYAVTNDTVTLAATPLAHQSRGPNAFGLTLWKLADAPRLSTVEVAFRPNGDIWGSAIVTAYDCAGGDLRLTLLPKETDRLEVDLDGRPALQADIGGRSSFNATIRVPRDHSARPCTFTIRGGPLLGSTVVLFERPG
jgi:hypothetical protein